MVAGLMAMADGARSGGVVAAEAWRRKLSTIWLCYSTAADASAMGGARGGIFLERVGVEVLTKSTLN